MVVVVSPMVVTYRGLYFKAPGLFQSLLQIVANSTIIFPILANASTGQHQYQFQLPIKPHLYSYYIHHPNPMYTLSYISLTVIKQVALLSLSTNSGAQQGNILRQQPNETILNTHRIVRQKTTTTKNNNNNNRDGKQTD